MERGELVYSSPNNSKLRSFLSISFLIFGCFVVISILYSATTGQLNIPGGNLFAYWFITLFLTSMGLMASILGAEFFLHRQFDLYANSITLPVSPIHIFPRERKLISCDRIDAFQRYGRDKTRIILYFNQHDRISYSHKPEVMDYFEGYLKKHKIKEFLDRCPHCDTKLYDYTITCPQCMGKIL